MSKERSTGAVIALEALADVLESNATTARADQFGEGWNAAIAYVAAICRGRNVGDRLLATGPSESSPRSRRRSRS